MQQTVGLSQARTNVSVPGIKILIVERKHLLQKFLGTPLNEISVNHIWEQFHPEYYYSDLVIFKGESICKVLKSFQVTPEPFFRTADIDQYIGLLKEIYDSGEFVSLPAH